MSKPRPTAATKCAVVFHAEGVEDAVRARAELRELVAPMGWAVVEGPRPRGRPSRLDADALERLHQMVDRGYSVRRIAKVLGVPRSTIGAYVKAYRAETKTTDARSQ